MLILALDTATPAVTAGLVELLPGAASPEVRTVDAFITVDARGHGELLAPAITDCVAAAGGTPIGAVVAGVGPGPFTGLRVGLVTAAALSDAWSVPAYGVCTLDAIAATAIERAADGRRLLVATDARRREVYWAAYRPDGTRLAGPHVDRPAALPTRLAETAETAEIAAEVRLVGAGGRLCAGALGRTAEDPQYPDVAALVALAADRLLAGAPGEPLTPLYLRRPDAVEPGVRKPVLR